MQFLMHKEITVTPLISKLMEVNSCLFDRILSVESIYTLCKNEKEVILPWALNTGGPIHVTNSRVVQDDSLMSLICSCGLKGPSPSFEFERISGARSPHYARSHFAQHMHALTSCFDQTGPEMWQLNPRGNFHFFVAQSKKNWLNSPCENMQEVNIWNMTGLGTDLQCCAELLWWAGLFRSLLIVERRRHKNDLGAVLMFTKCLHTHIRTHLFRGARDHFNRTVVQIETKYKSFFAVNLPWNSGFLLFLEKTMLRRMRMECSSMFKEPLLLTSFQQIAKALGGAVPSHVRKMSVHPVHFHCMLKKGFMDIALTWTVFKSRKLQEKWKQQTKQLFFPVFFFLENLFHVLSWLGLQWVASFLQIPAGIPRYLITRAPTVSVLGHAQMLLKNGVLNDNLAFSDNSTTNRKR